MAYAGAGEARRFKPARRRTAVLHLHAAHPRRREPPLRRLDERRGHARALVVDIDSEKAPVPAARLAPRREERRRAAADHLAATRHRHVQHSVAARSKAVLHVPLGYPVVLVGAVHQGGERTRGLHTVGVGRCANARVHGDAARGFGRVGLVAQDAVVLRADDVLDHRYLDDGVRDDRRLARDCTEGRQCCRCGSDTTGRERGHAVCQLGALQAPA